RQSSAEYKQSRKSVKQIGQELGVQYLLTGTVRWEKRGSGSRVRVSPELVQVATASTRWQQPFDAAMVDVFQVQGEIAGQVAEALDVALGAKEKRTLADRPTASLAAYEAYLKGEYEQAVTLDPAFARAWAALSISRTFRYINSSSKAGEVAAMGAAARLAAERALALDPEHPDSRRAMGFYLGQVETDLTGAAEQYAVALRKAPNDALIIVDVAGIERSLGRWAAALAHYERAAVLDPRTATTSSALGGTLLWLRRYPEARAALDGALALAPANFDFIQERAMVDLAQGNLAAARQVLAAATKEVEPVELAAFMATYFDLGWALDEPGQRLLLGLTPEPFADDTLAWGLVLAQMHAFRGDERRARAYADSAQAAAESALRTLPEDAQLHVLLGLALAYLGRRDEAVAEGKRGVALLPVANDAYGGAYFQHQLARIYILVGEPEKALDQLEPLLKISYYLSPGWLKIDPTFDSLRGHPRFERLLRQSPADGE
ncbi:MAG: TPR end-of-group domain-containing protein, partial [Gemmatimonadales bacterium]